ncbi:MAG TPA: HD domain-containing phosphohydrolase [Acidimicrobiales bacterium]|jgi:HD-GYP domain-containing protein (c-di-GMP phosphodiesterase class II)|nr:HD domain-containing phosphohydrolase [Acidimicrobiales bacterium]
MSDSGVRLSELLVALSLATDLGLGQPAEHMLRAARISMRLGERLGLDPDQLATLYDVSILTYVGCPVFGNEAATVFGDDIAFRAHAAEVDLAGFPALVFMLRRAGYGTSAFNRARQIAGIMASQGRAVVEQMANHCSAAGELADRLSLGPDVRAGIEQSYARWDGQGVPPGLAGDALALPARISHVAEACEVFQRTAGVEHAVEMVQSRRGTHFDPEVAAAVEVDPESLFTGIDDHALEEILDIEPGARPPLGERELDQALEAIGDFCDMRCPYFAGHSQGTADLVAGAADCLNLPAADAALARRAALVHDVGRFGVPGSVWDRKGPLTSSDRERMRMHVYYVERIFSRPEPLRRIGLLAATHHERMDASGYHRGVGGTMLSTSARVLAAADAFHAMTQPRPHRSAMSEADAGRQLRREADAGLLDPVAVDAVLTASGQAPSRARAGGPAGLTARESDVLALLARGLPNKGIARELGISPKTVGNHVERIYTKLGVTNRAGAAMRAMEYGLVRPSPAHAG